MRETGEDSDFGQKLKNILASRETILSACSNTFTKTVSGSY
jgi:hypothetical protein